MVLAIAAAAPAMIAAKKHPKPHLLEHAAPRPRPDVETTVGPLPDLSHALPAGDVGKLPSTADQYRTLKGDIATRKPVVDQAKARRDALQAQAMALREKLVATAARVQSLEREKIMLDGEIARLAEEDRALSAGFVSDRAQVARLLAVIERLQHDMPPAIALRPGDALSAARGAMLVGASLPVVYGKAAALARRIETLQRTRAALIEKRAEGVQNAAELLRARTALDQLLAIKRQEAVSAGEIYAALSTKLTAIAGQAANLQVLLERVAALRAEPEQKDVVVVTAQNDAGSGAKASLLQPVVGTMVPAKGPATGPGVTFLAPPGAQVVAPADCEVLFAGRYHKNGQVLILEVTVGYDLVLAGLDRIVVKPGDQVLAGEPVGVMPMRTGENAPQMGQNSELYFELRRNGRAASPAPQLAPDLRKAKRS